MSKKELEKSCKVMLIAVVAKPQYYYEKIIFWWKYRTLAINEKNKHVQNIYICKLDLSF